MFADPQTVTVNAVAKSLPAIERQNGTSVYKMDTGDYKLTFSHQYGRRNRFNVRLDAQKIASDPLASANNNLYSMSAYLVIDMPPVGYSNVEAKDIALALSAWATSANLLKVVGGET